MNKTEQATTDKTVSDELRELASKYLYQSTGTSTRCDNKHIENEPVRIVDALVGCFIFPPL